MATGARSSSAGMFGRDRSGLRIAASLAAAAVAMIVAFALYAPADEGVSARVTLREAGPLGGGGVSVSGERKAYADVLMRPSDAAEGAEWLNVTAWQGGGLVVEPLERVGLGRYRSTDPIPVAGDWKALIRLHDGNSLTALPLYMPADEAIPADEVPARAAFTRQFVDETQILQRERTGGTPALVALTYAAVVSITLLLLTLLVWGLHRLAFGPAPSRSQRRRPALPSRYSPISSTR